MGKESSFLSEENSIFSELDPPEDNQRTFLGVTFGDLYFDFDTQDPKQEVQALVTIGLEHILP